MKIEGLVSIFFLRVQKFNKICPIFRTLVKLRIPDRTSRYDLNGVLQITQQISLRTLSLNEIYDHKDDNFHVDIALYDLLSRHRETLEFLTLGLGKLSAPEKVWKLPIFPNLKRFRLLVQSFTLDFIISFETSESNFYTNFPKLSEFYVVHVWNWGGFWKPCLDYLFNERVVGERVAHFEIRDKGTSQTNTKETPAQIFNLRGHIDPEYARVFKTFPNADNKFMQDLRRYFIKKGTIIESRDA